MTPPFPPLSRGRGDRAVTLTFGSVCSGIEAASVAWHPLGWRAAFVSEIDAFPRAVLNHRYPEVPLHGDFTTIEPGRYDRIDLLVGGTPCQSFSIAGLRGGLADDRGNLALEYLRLADRLRPRWLVWENVPGVLSSNGGRDFGSILGGMVELGYGFAYRVLDAQHFGVPQRRRRVFVVGCAGDWRRAAAVLFERHSLSGHPAPSREAGQVAPTVPSRSSAGGGLGTDFDCDGGLIAHSLRAEGFDASEDGTGRGTPLVPVAFQTRGSNLDVGEISGTMGTNADRASGSAPMVAFAENSRAELRLEGADGQRTGALNAGGGKPGQGVPMIAGAAVRRLTPRECERLQGFPDDWTLVPYRGKPAADGPRYKALGNSMAVPVMRWIGERIAAVDALSPPTQEAAE
jgi:DNA (cytosine-5)-methyltransferase 1